MKTDLESNPRSQLKSLKENSGSAKFPFRTTAVPGKRARKSSGSTASGLYGVSYDTTCLDNVFSLLQAMALLRSRRTLWAHFHHADDHGSRHLHGRSRLRTGVTVAFRSNRRLQKRTKTVARLEIYFNQLLICMHLIVFLSKKSLTSNPGVL